MSRLKQWDKNYNTETAGHKLIAYKPMMREQLEKYFIFAEKLENTVKQIMAESKLPTWHNIPYLNFARRLAKLHQHYSGKRLEREIKLHLKLAQMNRLEKRLLIKICHAVAKLSKTE